MQGVLFSQKKSTYFQSGPEAEFTSPSYLHITLATGNKAELPALHDCDGVKNMLLNIQMAFKCVIAWNRMIRVHVKLVTCLN